LTTTALVVAETGWILNRQLGPAADSAFYRSIADGEIITEPLAAGDWSRIAELTTKYADQPLGGLHAALVAIAERLGLTTIATLDRRHFGVMRPSHADAFTLAP
jgi:predicted nucleic acid-binding protein